MKDHTLDPSTRISQSTHKSYRCWHMDGLFLCTDTRQHDRYVKSSPRYTRLMSSRSYWYMSWSWSISSSNWQWSHHHNLRYDGFSESPLYRSSRVRKRSRTQHRHLMSWRNIIPYWREVPCLIERFALCEYVSTPTTLKCRYRCIYRCTTRSL